MTDDNERQNVGASSNVTTTPNGLSKADALLYASQYIKAPTLNHFKFILATFFAHLPFISLQQRKKLAQSAKKRDRETLSSTILEYDDTQRSHDILEVDTPTPAENYKKMLREFDREFYLQSNPDVGAAGIDPFQHFLITGWKEGCNPNTWFDCQAYLQVHLDVAQDGMNPFEHYVSSGRKERRDVPQNAFPSPEICRKLQSEFDREYYLKSNPDVEAADVDPFQHFLVTGWKEGRNPNDWFDCQAYLQVYPDVLLARMNPFEHYLLYGRQEQREVPPADVFLREMPNLKAKFKVQDITFKRSLEEAENILVILIPEHNEMSGGIFSFFSIANTAYEIRHKHDFEVVLMTRPNKMGETYLRQRNFRNSEDVFRFEQIVRCTRAKTVYIHIPEYAVPGFVDSLHTDTLEYLRSRDYLFVNILNQKTDIMPEPNAYEDLRAITDQLTQSVAHHAYFGQSFADHYGTPLLLLPAYTDLSNYEAIPPHEKEKLIIYSPDEAPWKHAVLDVLAAGLPDYEMLEIAGITFDAFMDLASKCRYSVTFGEGFDGYLAQPIYQGGVGFAVYNDEFFPSEHLRDFSNIFLTDEEMVRDIVNRIRSMDEDENLYQRTNDQMMAVYDDLYSRDDYRRRVEMLINREFELEPLDTASWSRSVKL